MSLFLLSKLNTNSKQPFLYLKSTKKKHVKKTIHSERYQLAQF